MAGGQGSRFWPLSRADKPKQFLDILGTGKTLLQQTLVRFTDICPIENVYIVTNRNYKDLVMQQVPEVRPENIFLNLYAEIQHLALHMQIIKFRKIKMQTLLLLLQII
jgi:mannose-1-phosphate guanylyltransferase